MAQNFTCPHENMGTGGAYENKELNPVLKHLSPNTQLTLFCDVSTYLGTGEWGQVKTPEC